MILLVINVFFFVECLSENGQKKTKTCRRFTTFLCITVSNHSAVVAVCVCVCVRARARVCVCVCVYWLILLHRTWIISILCNFWYKLYIVKYPVNNFSLILSTRFKVICEIIVWISHVSQYFKQEIHYFLLVLVLLFNFFIILSEVILLL